MEFLTTFEKSALLIHDGLRALLPSVIERSRPDPIKQRRFRPLGRFAVTYEEVVAERAIGMRQTAGQRIDAGGVSKRLLGHPAACFAMHEAAPVTDQENLGLGGGHDEAFFDESGPPSD